MLIALHICIVFLTIAVVGSCVSTYLTARKFSLLADSMSHAALPGIAFVFYFSQVINMATFCGGAIISCVMSVILIWVLKEKTKLKRDTILALVLSLFFGAGLILSTIIQKKAIAGQSILNNFLFGNIYGLNEGESFIIFACNFIIFLFFLLTLSYQKLISFDRQFAFLYLKYSSSIDLLLLSFSIIFLVLGIFCIGVLLMSAYVIIPAAASYIFCSRTYESSFIISLIFALFTSFMSLFLTSAFPYLPLGATSVFCSSFSIYVCIVISRYLRWA